MELGGAANQAASARRKDITRARVTQIMDLLRLTPKLQQHILSIPQTIRQPSVTKRALRPADQLENHRTQVVQFKQLLGEGEGQ